MSKQRKSIYYLTQAAIIAALYAVLTLVCWTFSSLGIQVRISEAFCVLPLFTNAAVPGLFIGCFLANVIAGNMPDAIFGSLTTLAAAGLTYLIGRTLKGKLRLFLAPLPAVVLNAIAVPYILYYGYGLTEFLDQTSAAPVLALYTLSVFIGQTIACYGIGVPLALALESISRRVRIFGNPNADRTKNEELTNTTDTQNEKGEQHDEMQ